MGKVLETFDDRFTFFFLNPHMVSTLSMYFPSFTEHTKVTRLPMKITNISSFIFAGKAIVFFQ